MRVKKAGWWLATISALVCLLPFAGVIAGSLRYPGPLPVTLEQYGRALLQNMEFYTGFWNSLLNTALILLINIPVSLLAGYGFSQYRFPGRNALYWLYVVLMLLPFQAVVVPQYIVLQKTGLLGSRWAVILPCAFSTFTAFLLAQYMKGISRELLDAGRIDGLGELALFWRLAAPLCRPAVTAAVVLVFFSNWSMVEQPVVFLDELSQFPLSVLLNRSSALFEGAAPACGILFSVLPILLYRFCYDDLVEGISLGCVK